MLSLTRLSRCTPRRCLRLTSISSASIARLVLSNRYTRYNSSSANDGPSFPDALGSLAVPISAQGNIPNRSSKFSRSHPPHLSRGKSESDTSKSNAKAKPPPRARPNPPRRLNARQRRARGNQRQPGAKIKSKSQNGVKDSAGSSRRRADSPTSANPSGSSEAPLEYDPKVIDGTLTFLCAHSLIR